MANTPPVASNTRKKVNPSLKDLLDLFKKDLLLNMSCHHVGIIQSFDPDQQTAQVSVAYKKTYDQQQADGTYTTVLKNYPILVDVPVIVLSGGLWSLQFPVQKGDECLVLFNDRAIDSWFQSGQIGPVPVARFHSISDGFALVGVRSLARSIDGFATDRGGLFGPSQGEVSLSQAGKVRIANGTTTLGAAITQLLTDLNTLATNLQTNPISEPAADSAGVALAAALVSLNTLFGGLLE